VYLAYGTSYMLNISSELPGIAAGVLIRALEPLEGIGVMQQNRGIERLRDLARGPGRLAAALQIDRWLDGLDLCRKGRSGSRMATATPARSGGAFASASRATRTACCGFICAAVRSSAAPNRSMLFDD
jgi:DNA-3-methyladenine glycosylase